MITSTSLYWFTRIESIALFFKTASSFLLPWSLVFLVILLGIYIWGVSCKEEDIKKFGRKSIKYCVIMFIIGALLSVGNVFIPTKKELAFIYLTPMVVNSDFIQKDIPGEMSGVYKELKSYLKGQMGADEFNTLAINVSTNLVNTVKSEILEK